MTSYIGCFLTNFLLAVIYESLSHKTAAELKEWAQLCAVSRDYRQFSKVPIL